MSIARSAGVAGVLLAVTAAALVAQGPSAPLPPAASPAAASARAGFDLAKLDRIDAVVAEAIAAKQAPGAVVVVGRGDTVVMRRAYGQRAVAPAPEPMTLDTIFDLASLTKVVATTPAVMMLVEDGRIRLTDPVASFIPEFGKYGKDRVTVRDLLTHMSGLRPDVDVNFPWVGHDEAIRLATEEVLTQAPGRRFVYSDINYFLLAEIVARVSKQPFEEFVQQRLFRPLGMRETMFSTAGVTRAAHCAHELCTEFGYPCDGPDQRMLRGVVHDPTARRMGGVAGHAGLFSTAADLTIYARMLLGGGIVAATRVLAPLTVARMTSPATPGVGAERRGSRLGHGLLVLVEPRRVPAARVVRTHGLHRHVDVDGSGDQGIRHLPVQPRASRRPR